MIFGVRAVHGYAVVLDLRDVVHDDRFDITQQLGIGQVRRQVRDDLARDLHLRGQIALLQLLERRHDDAALPLRALPVGIADRADPGERERLIGVQVVHAGLQVPAVGAAALVRPVPAVQVDRLFFRQLHLDVADQGQCADEAVKIHFHIAVDGNAEVLCDDLVQQLHAAEQVGRVDPVVAVARNGHVHIAHQRGKNDLPRFRIDAADDHAVGALTFFSHPAVLADQQDILDRVVLHDADVVRIEGDLLRLQSVRRAAGPLKALLGCGDHVGRGRTDMADPGEGPRQEQQEKNSRRGDHADDKGDDRRGPPGSSFLFTASRTVPAGTSAAAYFVHTVFISRKKEFADKPRTVPHGPRSPRCLSELLYHYQSVLASLAAFARMR